MEIKNIKIIKNVLTGSFILVIALFLFFFVRSLYCKNWFSTFTYDGNVSPLAVFNLIVSSIIALGLGYYITKKLTEQRFMKEFIIADIKKVEEELENIEMILSTSNVTLETIFSALNNLNHKIERIENTARLINFKCNEIVKMKSLHFKIFEIATSSDNTSRIETVEMKYNLEPLYNDFSKSLRKMVYLLNKN